MCGYPYFLLGESEPAFDLFQTTVKRADELKWMVISMYATCALGGSYLLMGKPESARKHLETGIAIQKEMHAEALLSWHYDLLSQVHYEMGDYQAALNSIEKALSLAQRHHEKVVEGFSRIWLGRIIAEPDPSQHNRAEKSILKGIDILKSLKTKPYSSQGYLALGEVYTESGQTEKALENLKKAESMFKEMGMDYWLARTKEALERL
jgi:tetratricopeptide (TPR) repeat protein